MKKIIFIGIVIFAGFHFKPQLLSLFEKPGAFNEQGEPITMVFTHNACGKACQEGQQVLKKRRINYTQYNLDGNEANQALWKKLSGVNSFPLIISGDHRAYGSYKSRIVSSLALAYGERVLSRAERRYMKRHFNADGTPRVIIYGASWCGYCKKLKQGLEEKAIDYTEIDVEKAASRGLLTATLEITGYPLVYIGYRRLDGPRSQDVIAEL